MKSLNCSSLKFLPCNCLIAKSVRTVSDTSTELIFPAANAAAAGSLKSFEFSPVFAKVGPTSPLPVTIKSGFAELMII